MSEGETGFSGVEKLAASHDVETFDCGKEPLNQFLRRFALEVRKTEAVGLMLSGRIKARSSATTA